MCEAVVMKSLDTFVFTPFVAHRPAEMCTDPVSSYGRACSIMG